MNSRISCILPCFLPMVMVLSSCSEDDSKQEKVSHREMFEVEACKPVRQDVNVTREWVGVIEADPSGGGNGVEAVFAISEVEWLNYFAPMMRDKKLSGHPFTVTIEGDGSTDSITLPANVSTLSGGFDEATGTLSVRAKVLKPNDRLMSGKAVRVGTVLGVLKDALLVPDKAVIKVNEGYYVVGADAAKGVTYSVPVETGPYEGDMVVIESKIPEDMLVVTNRVNEAYGYSFINPDAPKAKLVVKVVDHTGKAMK